MIKRNNILQPRITEVRFKAFPDAKQREERVLRILLRLIAEYEAKHVDPESKKLDQIDAPKKVEDAFAYIRVSSEAQAQDDKVSLGEQLLDIQEHSQKTGTRIVRVFKDVASGDDIFRPCFLEMLEEVRVGPVKKIICWNANRLARGLTATGMSRAATKHASGVSKLSDYVRLSAKGKCHPL